MKHFFTLAFVLSLITTFAQPVLQEKSTLSERYQAMKAQAETYNDYKVIKAYQLDQVWRITLDSLHAEKLLLADAQNTIARLEAERRSVQQALEQKQASMEEIVYASTHISVLGINMDKRIFLTTVFLIIVGLLLMLGILTGRLKLMYTAIKEKMELANTTLHELEDYKRKSLEKQSKLSRELQNERNKLMELKRG